MTQTLRGKTAVVTGVSSGIGRATATLLVAAGVRVIGIARRSEKFTSLEQEFGSAFVPLVADLALPAERSRLVEEIARCASGVDIFVSNAAECVYESALDLPAAQLERLFQVNVLAGVELCAAIVPLMRGGGHVVQLSSVVADFMPNARFGPYAASKAAIEQFVLALRLELQPKGVRVSLVRPGLVDTPIYEKVPGFDATREKLNRQVTHWLEPRDVAEAIVWLLERPAHVTVSELDLLPTEQTR